MRNTVRVLLLFVAVATTTKAQDLFTNQNPAQSFGNGANYYPQPEDKDLLAEQFFYFDIDLLKEIANDQREGNILISPLSIKSVLAMILEGSEDETADELRMALHLPNNDRVRQQFQKLLHEFERPKGNVNLKMANRVFISENLNPIDEFRNRITQYYYSNITKVNWSFPVQTANTINSWVKKETNGVIPTIVNEGSLGEISILLANALYFKGMWVKAFSALETKVNTFYLSNGEQQMTPMMDVVDNFKYDEVKTLNAKVIELPYDGGEYSMVIVLPNEKNGIQQLARDFRNSINSIVHDMNKTEVFVSLPRFKIDYNVDLVNYLPKVHVNKMFGPQAKLTKMVVNVGTRVSNVLHKTFMEVNEQGTVAAAVTGAVVIPLMGTSKPRFKADHPFLFFIRHTATGTILFEGRLSVPERYTPQNHEQSQQSEFQQNQHQGNRQPPSVRPTQPENNSNQNVPSQTQPQSQTSQQPINHQQNEQQSQQFGSQQNQQQESRPSGRPPNQNVPALQPTLSSYHPHSFSSSRNSPANPSQSQAPVNHQTRFQSPAQLSNDQNYDFISNKQYVMKHLPPQFMVLPESSQLVQNTQSHDATVNDLSNNKRPSNNYEEQYTFPNK